MSRRAAPFPGGQSGSSTGRTVAAAAGRVDHEYIAGAHLDFARRTVFLTAAIRALDPVASDRARRTARKTERRDETVIRQHHGGHRLEKTHAPLGAVAAAMASRTAAAASNGKRFEPNGE